mgnify:CR=1 FL=1
MVVATPGLLFDAVCQLKQASPRTLSLVPEQVPVWTGADGDVVRIGDPVTGNFISLVYQDVGKRSQAQQAAPVRRARHAHGARPGDVHPGPGQQPVRAGGRGRPRANPPIKRSRDEGLVPAP